MGEITYQNTNGDIRFSSRHIGNTPNLNIRDNRQQSTFQRKLQNIIEKSKRVPIHVVQKADITENDELQSKNDDEEYKEEQEPAQLKENTPRQNNTGLSDKIKGGIENLSGLSMDAVRVHYNSDKPFQLNALAYTQGTDIHVAPGQEKHLAHEAWHVVQQMQGRVEPTLQMNGTIPVNDDTDLENEADEMGRKVQ
jgi:ribosome biogenesis GTPase A